MRALVASGPLTSADGESPTCMDMEGDNKTNDHVTISRVQQSTQSYGWFTIIVTLDIVLHSLKFVTRENIQNICNHT